jgi:hypothetical protein
VTEAEWLACTDPTEMLEFLRGKVSDRKLRLFAVACCWRIWDALTEEAGRHAVEMAGRYADGEVTESELDLAADVAATCHSELEDELEEAGDPPPTADVRRFNALEAACRAAGRTGPFFLSGLESMCDNADWARERDGAEYRAQCGLLRDIVGNPFRPVTADPACLTSTAVGLARAIYDERAFDRLSILADALEDADCDNVDILNHLRDVGPHFRGCWAVDLVLGKE